MTSTFAAQLRTIAANSTNELDLRARRESHADSLVFERSVAVKQDWDTIYQICLGGFQELCLLDSSLREFEHNLYSPQAKDQDREQLSKSQNEALDVVLERCLALLASKVLLRPGVKAVEWLVRRFRVHVYNVGALLATFLPYHETAIFRNVLSIVPPNKAVGEWKFLGPYHKDAMNVPRHAIVYSATNNDAFFSYFNNYTLRVCQEGAGHSQLLRFWTSVIVEAVTGRLHQVKSGRREVQRQRTEDALLKILPLLDEGFEVKDCPELTVACFTISLVLVGNSELEDHVIDALMKTIAPFVVNGEADARSALACVAILATKKQDKKLPRDVLNILMKAIEQSTDFAELHQQVSQASLCEALVSSALSGLKQKNLEPRIRFTERVLHVAGELFDSSTKSRIIAVVLRKLPPQETSKSSEPAIRGQLVRLLQSLNDSPDFSPCFANAASIAGLSQSDLEGLLEGTILTQPISSNTESSAMEVDSTEQESTSKADAAKSMLASLPPQFSELSFLSQTRSSFFDQLAQAFALCYPHEELLAQFENLPVWRQKTENPTDLHTDFLLRLALSRFPVAVRRAGLQLLSRSLESGLRDHTQLLIPYITVLLSDEAQSIRQPAVACMVAIQKCVSKQEADEHQNAETDYDALLLVNSKRIASTQALKLLNQVYLPHLEECILDASQMHKILHAALEGHGRKSLPKNTEIELNKTSKHALFDLLTGCALRCPLLRIQLGIIELLSGIARVGTSVTSKTLSPILEGWSARSDADAENAVLAEGLSLAQVDATMVQLIKAQDKEIVETILAMLTESKFQPRAALLAAIFERFAVIWKDIRPETQISTAVHLFDMSFSEIPALAAGSRGLLHAVTPSTEIFAAVLDHSVSGLAQMQTDAPPKKRRRVSHGRESLPKDMAARLEVNEARLTFALELVEDAKPENHPQLLAGLFGVLISLRRLKDKNTQESPYLLNLCLSILLAIIDEAQQSRKHNIDLSSIRADLVTDCVRSSENPQVQSTALLLSASLALLAPDRILHTIMPIFTFMGSSILAKDDERSIYVTNRAIDKIIPPLVASLKRHDAKNLIHSTANLLSSFVAAYDHVPQHRRVSFYQRLLSRLGADDFSFAVIALLASRRQEDEMSVFFTSLMTDFLVSTQLQTARKLLDLAIDVFSGNPHNAEPLLDISRTTTADKREQQSLVVLGVVSELLQPRSLKSKVARLSKSKEAEKDGFWAEFKLCISRLLGMLKSQKTQHSTLTPATRKCLSTVLELPSLADLLAIMPDLLNELAQVEDTRDLQSFALRVLATQLYAKNAVPKDNDTQTEATSFLATLEGIIKASQDESFRHAAIQCFDRIVEAYGRKDPDAVAVTLSCLMGDGNRGLDSDNERTQIMSLLCLMTSMEVLKEGGLTIVLATMSKVLKILSLTSRSGGNVELHNACYTLLSSFITHVPFMISDENSTQIFEISYHSCRSMRGEASCTEARLDTLRLMSQKLALDSVTTSLGQAIKTSISTDLDSAAIMELMEVLSQAIEQSSKTTVVKSADATSNLILEALGMRQLLFVKGTETALSDDDFEGMQKRLNALGIVFIYKLNDTTFRPMFESWADWAVRGRSDDPNDNIDELTATLYRTTSFFSFANHFFETLKSIVTSYASFILPAINEVFKAALTGTNPSTIPVDNAKMGNNIETAKYTLDLSNTHQLTLYQTTLTLLTTLATHDGDAFFTSPSHFQPLATLLVQQFTLIGTSKLSKPLRQSITHMITSALIALATSVQDVPAHHHTLNHLLCQLRHSDTSAVRLASISVHIALTESDVGEEWVQNVVLGQASSTEEGVSAVGGSGETMVYVNEMLEDDDEDVERSVRDWVRMVRERVGEDVFEV